MSETAECRSLVLGKNSLEQVSSGQGKSRGRMPCSPDFTLQCWGHSGGHAAGLSGAEAAQRGFPPFKGFPKHMLLGPPQPFHFIFQGAYLSDVLCCSGTPKHSLRGLNTPGRAAGPSQACPCTHGPSLHLGPRSKVDIFPPLSKKKERITRRMCVSIYVPLLSVCICVCLCVRLHVCTRVQEALSGMFGNTPAREGRGGVGEVG